MLKNKDKQDFEKVLNLFFPAYPRGYPHIFVSLKISTEYSFLVDRLFKKVSKMIKNKYYF